MTASGKEIVWALGIAAALIGVAALPEIARPAPPAPSECEVHTFMCCRTFVEEPDCKAGQLACRPGFEVCEVEDAGP